MCVLPLPSVGSYFLNISLIFFKLRFNSFKIASEANTLYMFIFLIFKLIFSFITCNKKFVEFLLRAILKGCISDFLFLPKVTIFSLFNRAFLCK